MTLAEVSSIERCHCQACARYTFEISAFGTIYPLAHVEPFRLQTADFFLMSVPGRIHALKISRINRSWIENHVISKSGESFFCIGMCCMNVGTYIYK